MKPMQTWRWLPASVLLALGGTTTGRADGPTIQAFKAGNGEIVFSAVENATNYQVHTTAMLTGAWSNAVAAVAPTAANALTTTVSMSEATAFYRVVAFTNLPPGPGVLYLVVDLSGGASAPSYPVSYLDAVPPGGWTDEYKTTNLVLRRIPATTPDFTMGQRSTDYPDASDDGLHQVTLTKDFYIGVFEVTQRQWELVMGNKPSNFNNASYYATRPVEMVSYYEIRENPLPVTDASHKGSAISPSWPATNAVHADSFMGKIRAKTGLSGFDLPTESQWEYACRAGTTTALNSGQDLTIPWETDPQMNVVGRYWYNGGSGGTVQNCPPSAGTAMAGSYLVNAWGLYDMHGNAWEWCLDWYGTYPGTVSDPLGAGTGSYRMFRGGSWNSKAGFCSSAYRKYTWPNERRHDRGFRVARSLP